MTANGIFKGKFITLLGIGCAVMLAFAKDARAVTIGYEHQLGLVQSAGPEGDRFITQYVNFMIGLALGDSDHITVGPQDILIARSKNDFGTLPGPATLALRGELTTIDLGTQGTYDYLFAHYGGPGGGFAEVWYVGGLSESIRIPGTSGGHGLSGWALFAAPNGAVPDGGATAMLLGAALSALGVIRRFWMR
jgi:hypothetical protein